MLVAASVMVLGGLALLVAGAWLVAPWLGLMVTGAALGASGWRLAAAAAPGKGDTP